MEDVANDRLGAAQNLPSTDRGRAASSLARGLSVADALGLPVLHGTKVLAGEQGLDRVIQRLNVMEVPDILPWVKPHELLLTTGYPLRSTPQDLTRLVCDLAERDLAAVAIKLGRYVAELPDAMLRAADERGLPILLLGDHVAFDDVLNHLLTDILNRQAAILGRAEEVHRVLVDAILAGGGLAAITERLPALLDGGVMVTTPDGRVLASSGVPESDLADPAYFDPVSGRFLVEGFKHGLHALDDDQPRVAQVPVMAGSLDHGRIVLITRSRRLDPADLHLLERAAATAALVITRDLAVAAVEGKYQGDFLRDVLDGRAGDTGHIVAHCASLGWDVDRPLVVVVAELGPEPPGPVHAAGDLRPAHERFMGAWTMVVRERDPKAAIAGYSQEVVVIMGLDRAPARPQGPADPGRRRGGTGAGRDGDCAPGRLVRAMVAQVSGDGGGGRRSFATGFSRVVTSPEAIPAAYEQARQAARVGRQMHGTGAVAGFDDLGVFRLISLVPDGAELRSFMAETLGPLALGDDTETADLRHTLEVLLDNNLNVAETARLLHFHYNTLRYRIGKLERMLGPFTADPDLRLNLMMALRVIRMRGLS
ncbi:purine catabolism regulator [Murinocardiopsis flavida]|uniref:Purine catabolism regulator n=1 Tax=Murinocardiopsis flavida TaxID=645275 RepID=A0A2P8CVZ6_9ACTN|nr:PucR family transcriptional regulator ligand-binding domain-containing protein [Murinocardiopsis flavida]PSK89144.1 purine catabolism regulator [Murinocardiopsis flavida]